jgi:nucleoside 2-deoxyribosyltransferase
MKTNDARKEKRFRVYLAGPEVFLRNAIEIGKRKKELCAKYGFEGLFPIDAELELKNLNPMKAGLLISLANEKMISSCDLLIANLTPFRGPSADVGTAYEMGFARGLGKRIFAYTNTSRSFIDRTISAVGRAPTSDNPQRFEDKNFMAIEQWGFVDNLMLEGSIIASNGVLVVDDAYNDAMFTYLGAFEKCLIKAKKLMSENR